MICYYFEWFSKDKLTMLLLEKLPKVTLTMRSKNCCSKRFESFHNIILPEVDFDQTYSLWKKGIKDNPFFIDYSPTVIL